mgnify:CR=1 FL=1
MIDKNMKNLWQFPSDKYHSEVMTQYKTLKMKKVYKSKKMKAISSIREQ